MGVASKIFLMLIPLVFLFVVLAIFLGGEGLLEKVKGAVLGAKDILPKVSVGLEEQKAEVTIPDEHRTQILNLQQRIVFLLSGRGRGAARENCFDNYGTLPDLGEGGTSLKFELRGDKTVLTVFGGAGGKQVITDLSTEFPNMKPCVIAGEGEVSKNFVAHFLDEKKLYYPYFTGVNSLTVWDGTSGDTGNRIGVGNFDADTVNDEGDNLENAGWLFTPDGEHICFFPTNKIADYDDDGIDNDYFGLAKENSIPNRINQGKLLYCS